MKAKDENEWYLGQLLAVFHGDGGHHQAAVGTEQAAEEMLRVLPSLLGLYRECLGGNTAYIKCAMESVTKAMKGEDESGDPMTDCRLPLRAYRICQMYDAWVVGSAALPDDGKPVEDIDIMVPFHHWNSAAMLIPEHARMNAFGGWKWTEDDGTVIDLWPDRLERLAAHPAFYAAWHPASGTRLRKEGR